MSRRAVTVVALASAMTACTTTSPARTPSPAIPAPTATPTTPAPAPTTAIAEAPSDPAAPVGDADGDKLDDVHDQCPDEPETYNGSNDEDGCPDRPHGRGEPRWRSDLRQVSGPGRPEDCPVFRKILSPAGQLELRTFEFGPGETTFEIWTGPMDDIVEITTTLESDVWMCLDPGTIDVDGDALSADRIEFVRSTLIARGAPASRLRAGTGSQCRAASSADAPSRGRLRFRVADRTTISTSYFCTAETRS